MAKSVIGRMVRDRQEAAELLAQWEDAGERMSDWCGARGINWYSLNAYRGRGGVLPAHDEPKFVELTVAVPPVCQTVSTARYLVRVGDIEVELDDHFRGETLGRLLKVVAAC